MALRSVWWQLGERGPDTVEHLLPPSDTGSDGHHRSGRLPPGPQPDLLQAAGAQRGDPRHDPPRSGVPGRHNVPPRLQRLRDQSLTGAQEPPAPSFPTFVSPVISSSDPLDATPTSSTTADDVCPPRRGPAPTHLAPPSARVSAARTARLQVEAHILSSPSPEPESLDSSSNLPLLSSSAPDSHACVVDFPSRPPDLFSSHCCTRTPDALLPCTRAPRKSCLHENFYCPFSGHPSHSSALLDLHRGHPASCDLLQTVASEPTLLSHADADPLPIRPRGSHLPHFPRSPFQQPGPSAHRAPEPPAPASFVLTPRPPPPCPAAPEEPLAWGCCCTLSGAAAPLTHYLGKVGQAALPLLKVGGLLKTEPSDVQT